MIIYIFIAVGILLYLWINRKFQYWSKIGLESYRGGLFESLGPKFYLAYYYFKQKRVRHGGTFMFLKSAYMPIDLNIIKHIVQTDFGHFVNRGFFDDPPPLLKSLAHLENDEWRTWRARLTPTFTSGKIKMMFHTMVEKAWILKDLFTKHAIMNEAIDVKDIYSRYITDIIGSTGFGIECNSLENPNADFLIFAKKLFARVKVVMLLSLLPQKLLKILGIRLIPKELESFFYDVVKRTIECRESNNIFRKDFMHLLLQLKNKGKVTDEVDENILEDKNRSGDHISLDEIVAHCFVFFAAGFETSSSALTFAMFELAENQQIQDTLRKNIRDVLKEHDGKFTYDAIMKMDYLDKVVQETLRKHPQSQFSFRRCDKEFPVPGTNFVIKKGQLVVLPIRAVHHDPDYWPEPEKFDPERFNAENISKRPRLTYLPFGEGPRMCIGSRFALIQIKIGIASVINSFRLRLSEKTRKPIEIDYSSVTTFKDIIWMNIENVK